jgi:hypothetical protein
MRRAGGKKLALVVGVLLSVQGPTWAASPNAAAAESGTGAAAGAAAGGADTGGASPRPSQSGGNVFTPAPFWALYPIFLVRRSMDRGPKAALWGREYAGRWVRWTGKLVSFAPNGVTVKMLSQTVTFDVSLVMDVPARVALKDQDYRPGDRIEYIGQLDSYDDIFRTLYLSHGAIVGKARP